jgi:hypothetical protein
MDFNRKLEELLNDIREIEHDAVDIYNNQQLSRIEMDLLMGKVRGLYDKLISMDRHYPYANRPPQEEVPPEYNPPRQQPAAKEPTPSSVEQKPQEQEKQTPPKPKPTPETSQELQSQPASEATWKGSENNKGDTPEIVADKYQNSRTFRHDDLASKQPQNNLSSRMQSKPITDLSKAIGLNDKFLFIRELFEGDKDRYHEAIQIINEMPNYQEAEAYIRQRFEWSEDKPEVVRFMDLVRRKFSNQSE